MKNDIRKAKRIMDGELGVKRPIYNYTRKTNYLYSFTNENVNAYLNQIDMSGFTKSLTVLGSGDHLLGLVSQGIQDIDTFDINKLTEYYVFGLKIPMIMKYDFNQFKTATHVLYDGIASIGQINQIIVDLLPYMDKKYRRFWLEVTNHARTRDNIDYENCNNSFVSLFYKQYRDNYLGTSYFDSEEGYNLLKQRLEKVNFRFNNGNILKLIDRIDDKYDIILLSNVLNYVYLTWGDCWHDVHLNQFLDSLNGKLNENGIAFLQYNFFGKNQPFFGSAITIDQFNHDEVLDVPNISSREKNITDKVILYRKK